MRDVYRQKEASTRKLHNTKQRSKLVVTKLLSLRGWWWSYEADDLSSADQQIPD